MSMSGWSVKGRQAIVEAYKSQRARHDAALSMTAERGFWCGDMCWVEGSWSLPVKVEGKNVTFTGHGLMVYRRHGDQWLIQCAVSNSETPRK